MEASNANFSFLAQAKPATLHRLLAGLPAADAAIALAGLPTALAVQVMAYFPETSQAELVPAMRSARAAAPERIARTVAAIRSALAAAKSAAAARPAAQEPQAPPAQTPQQTSQQSPQQSPQGRLARAAYGAASVPATPKQPAAPPARPKKPDEPETLADRYGGASPFGSAQPWTPRAAQTSPINGPALPGKPAPVAGDPLKSPLARAGLLDLLGRAQEKLLPGRGGGIAGKTAGKLPPAGAGPATGKNSPTGKAAGNASGNKSAPPGRPAAREGVLRSVPVAGRARVLGPPGAAGVTAATEKTESSGARRMDGKAILAAIIREAGSGVRDNVRSVDPALYRDLQKRMFYFDDLQLTGDNALAQVFTVAPEGASALALRFAAPALRERVLRVVSPGRAAVLRDSARAKSLDDVETAQQKVLDVALRLQAAGRILIDPRDPDLAG